ncbi:MAG: tetratricopeptide repeat protein [Kofleriaceae bacterium]
MATEASARRPPRFSALHAARAIGWTAGAALAPALLGAVLGRRGVSIGVACAFLATGWLLVWLPRAAHRAFEAARYPRAGRRYRLIAALAFTARRERAAVLSRAGCLLAAGKLAEAAALLAAFDPAALEPSERVVWLNNRACVELDRGGEAAEALALVERAIELRPDVPAIQHTRARALLAVGRVDDAIHVLEAMRTGGELAAPLEADRCRELALAWERKGHADYAADYRERARRSAAS